MVLKRAKVLTDDDINKARAHVRRNSHMPERDDLLILLTCYAGLRIGEACALHAAHFMQGDRMEDRLFISGRGAKYGKSREVPLRLELKNALENYVKSFSPSSAIRRGLAPIFLAQHGGPLKPNAAAQQLKAIYASAGLFGCSSHSGRRTFGTRVARLFAQRGGSLIDVRDLLGHADIKTTTCYVDPSPLAVSIVSSI